MLMQENIMLWIQTGTWIQTIWSMRYNHASSKKIDNNSPIEYISSTYNTGYNPWNSFESLIASESKDITNVPYERLSSNNY